MTDRRAEFSADRAWEDLRALTQIGPRVIDTQGNVQARNYIQAQLEKLNLEVKIDEYDVMAHLASETEDGESQESEPRDGEPESDASSLIVRNISVTIPGQQSSGSIMLIAPYDTQAFEEFDFVGANDGGSGAAVLLELSRVIAADPLPYATEVVFVDGHAPFSVPEPDGAMWQEAGLAHLAITLSERSVSDIHLVVYLNRIGDADLHIVRDLLSHRIYREEFFEAARRLGQTVVFQQDAPFESTGLKHQSLSAVGIRRIVSIVDTAYGGDEPPGLYAGTEQDTLDHCSPESLGAVGGVVLEGLEAISKWLIKIERFSQLPLEASPESEQAAADSSGDETRR
ncbi:MAG: M28 family peptidase [Myxococcota bacterium]